MDNGQFTMANTFDVDISLTTKLSHNPLLSELSNTLKKYYQIKLRY
jgi:hypothetical protein